MSTLDFLLGKNSPLQQKGLNHRNLYLLGLTTILCGLAWSNALMSIGQFILAGNWLIEFGFRQKLKRLRESPLLLVLISIFLLHLLGLAWTTELDYGLKDIRIKLPLLILPFIIGTSEKLNRKEFQPLALIYIITLFLLTVVSYGKYFGIWGEEIVDKRQLSIYVSHIRYGLNIAFAIGLLFFIRPIKNNLFLFGIIAWFLLCLIIFQLYSGLIILLLLSFLFSVYTLFTRSYNKIVKRIIPALVLLFLLGSFVVILQTKQEFDRPLALNYDQFDTKGKRSAGGELYWSDLEDTRAVNGVYIRRFVAWKELEREWNKRSSIPFWEKDLKGQTLDQTLNRFLASRGFRKDSVGISKLSDREIQAIEKGIACVYYLDHNAIQNRIYNTFFEWEEYKRTGNASGYSLMMRYEFWKTALSIIHQNFWFGTGTGDIEQAFREAYENQQSKLDQQFRKRAHNQYLTFFATFGLLGLCVFLFALLFPLFQNLPNRSLYLFFWGVLCFSFLTEDTLETQAGVTLFALFNGLLALGAKCLSPVSPDNEKASA